VSSKSPARIDDLVARAGTLLEWSRRLVTEAIDPIARSRNRSLRPYSIQPVAANNKLNPIRVEIANNGRKRFVPCGPAYAASTYASIAATCPITCAFKDNGCYAQAGAGHLTMGRLDAIGRTMVPLDVTLAEADGLSRLWPKGVPQDGGAGGRDLRLHVGGESSCEAGARALADAVAGLKSRGLGTPWTFTHRWAEIDRDAWGPIGVLASIDHADDAGAAMARGYAPAITVPEFDGRKLIDIGGGAKAIPCPYEAGADLTCVTCRLCLDEDLLGRRRGIAFRAHGRDKLVAIERLAARARSRT